MKIIALIPARKNSKRIKKKNIKKLKNLPLITWTILAAKKVKEISDIYVSTDDAKVIKICRNHKIIVPWKRPAYLSKSNTTSEDVAIHFLNWYEKKISKIDGLLLLQPTSPFRKKKSIQKAIKIFKKNKGNSIVSFSPTNKKKLTSILNFNKKINLIVKKKNLVNSIKLNGSIYLTSPKNLRKYKSFLKPSVLPLIQNSIKESIDIDTYKDWKIAKKIAG